MNSSDSEGFESADEGTNTPIKRERKKRLSSSNYSDTISDYETKKNTEKTAIKAVPNQEQATDGWDDWGDGVPTETVTSKEKIEVSKSQDTENSGWDDFDDWGDTNVIPTYKQPQSNTNQQQQYAQTEQNPAQKQSPQVEQDIKSVTDRLAATTTKSDGWGWGWGVDSLLSTASAGLSTATAGLSTITSQVSQGISTVLETVETGIGAPDPEELARRAHQNKESESKEKIESNPEETTNTTTPNEASFPFGSLFSGVTKFVETTGTKVISGGLDTLETIGKKTMEVLQDGDPLLAKKRAMLGLDSGDKPVLSQLLREAKDKADEEDKVKEAKREAKEVHYETLFDDYEGLIHLEALEMLSKQVSMRIDERLRSTPLEKRQDMKETLQQVAELCEMPEDEDDDDADDESSPDTPKPEAFHDKLQKATKDIGLKLQFQPLIKHYSDVLDAAAADSSARGVYKRAVGSLAACTALGVQLYHKTGEMLLVKPRRSTADEADALTQMTVVLTKHISELATLFTEKLNTCSEEDQEQVNNYITNVFLEAGNSSKYIENAFQLTLPIIQIGAV